jgi:hypothetical protein
VDGVFSERGFCEINWILRALGSSSYAMLSYPQASSTLLIDVRGGDDEVFYSDKAIGEQTERKRKESESFSVYSSA